jgi:hypothetical protein
MRKYLILTLAVSVAGCVSSPESVTVEKKKSLTIVHHRRRTSGGLVDRIDAISSNGLVTQAEVHVYDVGRIPRPGGGMDEAHAYYRVVQSPHWETQLPKKEIVSRGPKTVYTPPNYVPPPNDQRVNDAIAEAKAAKQKLDIAAQQIQDRLKEDNNLRGELQTQIDENQRLQDQINAGFNTPKHEKVSTQTDAEKAAQSAVDPLVQWGNSINQQ